MEFLPLSGRRSSARNVPSGEERGETDVFAGYAQNRPNPVTKMLTSVGNPALRLRVTFRHYRHPTRIRVDIRVRLKKIGPDYPETGKHPKQTQAVKFVVDI